MRLSYWSSYVCASGLICAGRTDTGVHARGQVVHLDTPVQRRMESWVRGLNALLPDSIAVQWAQAVPDEFHARFSALSRRYIYLVRNARQRSPLMPARAAWVYHSIHLARMRQAAKRLVVEPYFSRLAPTSLGRGKDGAES